MPNVYNPHPNSNEREDVATTGDASPPEKIGPRELAVSNDENAADYKALLAALASSDADDPEDDATQCQAVDVDTYMAFDGEDA